MHVGVDSKENVIVFIIKVTRVLFLLFKVKPSVSSRPWADMAEQERLSIQRNLTVLMQWAGCVAPINNNGVRWGAAYFEPALTTNDLTQAHSGPKMGAHGDRSENRKKEGRMYAAGWHGSMEPGKSIVTYATKPDKAEEWVEFAVVAHMLICGLGLQSSLGNCPGCKASSGIDS